MKLFVFSIMLLLGAGSNRLYAQLQGQARVDSLLGELPRQKEDTSKVKLLYGISFGFMNINPDEGIKYAEQELALATKLNWVKGISMGNSNLGNNYYRKSDYAKALEYFQKALDEDEVTGYKKGIASDCGNMGTIYKEQGNYPKSLECYFKALRMYEDMGFKVGIGVALINIGTVYQFQSDYPKALEYYSKALKIDEETNNLSGQAYNNSNIGLAYQYMGDYPKALEFDFKALKMQDELGDKSGVAKALGNIGSVYILQKNYTMAIEQLQKALVLNEQFGNKRGAAVNLANIGECFLRIAMDSSVNRTANGQHLNVDKAAELTESKYQPTGVIPSGKSALLRSAIDNLQRSLAIAREIQILDIIQENEDDLAQAYKLSGDFKKALAFAEDARVIKDSVFSRDNSNKILKMEYERKFYGDSLKAADAKRIIELRARQQRNYMYIGLGVIALLAGFSFFLSRNNKLLSKEKKQSEALLLNILPEEVASQLKKTGAAAARQFDDVTVLFTDFVNFTEAGERMNPQTLIDELHTCFKKFDEVTGRYHIEKIKTIGDAYLAVAGLPAADPAHAENAVRAAEEINDFMQDRVARLGDRTFQIRIGVHSGSVVAGIVGVKKFAYDIWGDTVNTAARMEQNSEPGRINISETTYELVKGKIACVYRGEIQVKGKGGMKMYYVAG